MVKVKSGWTTCPICQAKLKAGKLDGHVKNVHPTGVWEPGARSRIQRRRYTASRAARGVAVAGVLALIILVVFLAYTHMPVQGAKVGEKPYAFTLTDQNGRAYALYDNVGTRPLLMAFMSSTCMHCAATADVMHNLYQNHSSKMGFVILISNNDATAYNVSSFHLAHHLQFPALYDAGGSTFHKYRASPRYFPTLYLIDGRGRINWIGEGAQTYGDLDMEVSSVL